MKRPIECKIQFLHRGEWWLLRHPDDSEVVFDSCADAEQHARTMIADSLHNAPEAHCYRVTDVKILAVMTGNLVIGMVGLHPDGDGVYIFRQRGMEDR